MVSLILSNDQPVITGNAWDSMVSTGQNWYYRVRPITLLHGTTCDYLVIPLRPSHTMYSLVIHGHNLYRLHRYHLVITVLPTNLRSTQLERWNRYCPGSIVLRLVF